MVFFLRGTRRVKDTEQVGSGAKGWEMGGEHFSSGETGEKRRLHGGKRGGFGEEEIRWVGEVGGDNALVPMPN